MQPVGRARCSLPPVHLPRGVLIGMAVGIRGMFFRTCPSPLTKALRRCLKHLPALLQRHHLSLMLLAGMQLPALSPDKSRQQMAPSGKEQVP